MIKPERLQKGDTIGIIAPAGPPDQEKLQKAIPFLESLGLKVNVGKHINEIHGYLAGTDQQRLEDFHNMVADPTIKAIIFARGGYGTGRIVSSIDYELIRNNPKIIWGYSDITYLHTAIRQQTGLVTFHGPMVASDIGKEEFDDFSAEMFMQLFEPATYVYTEKVSPLHVISPGNGTGMLVGGNLSLIVSTLGTPFEIDTNGKLLLLEDIGEEPYRVDSMLNQLKLAGKLEKAAGVILGDFADAEPTLKHSLTLEKVFSDYLSNLNCPVLSGFKIGHCLPHFAVPLGVEAELSADTKTLTIQAGVK
ncbi:LD-carboxypeptidase [Virgibacillus sp. SK37]|uniref:S66 peptidase family protein n=1 Tax=Virgibacillus sp. SK37 TaxID=403957 RepID=UPI0004D10C81|nr:LD-carboxypeptidase [Virgibacillus sp. SK37]AIF44651.1 peptidase S66 [Virgibacillus sp. SK37]